MTKKIDLLFALGQVVLIFVGVSVAIWFENLNEDRKDRKQQILLLKEMIVDLEEEEYSLDRGVQQMEKQMHAGTRIMAILDHRSENIDSLGTYVEAIIWYWVGNYSTAAYETIKSQGLVDYKRHLTTIDRRAL